MSKEIALLTTVEDFHELHELADGRQTKVRINRETLLNLLLDHTVMSTALMNTQGQFRITEPRKRVRVRAKT